MENLEYQENKEAWNNDSSADISDVLKRTLVACWGERRLDKCESFDRVKTRNNDWEEYSEITIYPWDCSDWKTERAEIQAKNKLKYDVKYKQKFSFKIPKDFVLDGNRLVIWQWKRSPAIREDGDDAPLLSQRIRMDEEWQLYFVVTDGYREEIWKRIPVKMILWEWVDMRYEVIFTDDDSDTKKNNVSIKATCKWKSIKIYEWQLNIPHPKEENSSTPEAYFKFWIYRDIHEHNQKENILFKNYSMKEIENKTK